MKIEIKNTYIIDGVEFNDSVNAEFFLKYLNKKNTYRETKLSGALVMVGLKELLNQNSNSPTDSIIELDRYLQLT